MLSRTRCGISMMHCGRMRGLMAIKPRAALTAKSAHEQHTQTIIRGEVAKPLRCIYDRQIVARTGERFA
jgi:hypothetical protein